MMSMLGSGVLVATLVVAAASDLRTRRIPNSVTLSALLIALLLRLFLGFDALGTGLLGAGLALLILLPLFAVRAVGGGDAKLLIVVGAFLGPKGFLIALLGTAVVGGVMSVGEALRRGALLPILFGTGDLVKYWATLGRSGERVSLATPGVISVPYGVAIAIGSVVALFLGGGIS